MSETPATYWAAIKEIATLRARLAVEKAAKEAGPILAERKRQDDKWGVQDHDDPLWLAILTEEVGEAAQCICRANDGDAPAGDIDKEIVQVAAVALAWLECRKRAALRRLVGRDKP